MTNPGDFTGMLLAILAIGVIPFVAMVVTSYAKIVIVLGLLRNALGVQQVPPNMVLNGIAILATAYVMAPIGFTVFDKMNASAPLGSHSQYAIAALSEAEEPFRAFLQKNASTREKRFFLRSAVLIWPKPMAERLHENDFIVLAPAFTLTQLTDSFRIGFCLYIAFIAIDLIIANVLVAMGLNQLQPTNVAIPFKLLLFVAMDGWSALVHGLVTSYR